MIPKTLAVNAAKDSTDLVAKLRSYHHASQTVAEKSQYKWYAYYYYNFDCWLMPHALGLGWIWSMEQ